MILSVKKLIFHSLNRLIAFSFYLILTLCLIFPAFSQKLTVVKPEEAGMSSDRLKRINMLIQKYVDEKKIAGMVAIVAREGKVVLNQSSGLLDLESKKPMQSNSIFRITSMSKPVISIAAMMLFEEGHFQLDDPVSKFIPEFKDMKVWNNGNPVPPKREMTIGDLLTKTSGLSIEPPLDSLYQEGKIFEGTLKEMVGKLSNIPLMYHPGEKWVYNSNSYDVVAYLIETISGLPLDVFLKQRIFQPLKMLDTDFYVPKEKQNRLAVAYGPGEGGKLQNIGWSYDQKPIYLSGEMGLVSTAEDFMRLALMLLNGGELNGARILSPKTIELMTINHLPPHLLPIVLDPSIPYYTQGYGFGLGVRVLQDLSASGNLGSEGMYGWGGYYGTFLWIDPKEKLAGILLTQFAPIPTYSINKEFQTLMYQAIVK